MDARARGRARGGATRRGGMDASETRRRGTEIRDRARARDATRRDRRRRAMAVDGDEVGVVMRD